ncbi:asparagine synthase (glutamine-hydrolyzing) [bacterium]|nr:asparagine synthase (glutamine-hydrolyzing) [candidate division CSSED10-310 bacterium]
MCGICGVSGRCRDGTVERMTSALYHRGPDSEGYYWDERVSLGMRRLKIIDLEGSEQPVFNEDRTLVLICNGEIYNYRSLRQQLEYRGHRFSTQGDVETILHLYEEYGDECVQYLDGMFAFALWDTRRQRLILVRDRLGIKPLYYCKLPNKLLFASEIRSIIASCEIDPNLDELAIMKFVSFPAVQAPLTIFRQITALLPGHFLDFSAERYEVKEYWDVDFVKADTIKYSPGESVEVVREKLTDAVRKRLMSDVPLGAFLSGGIDSSAIVGLMGTMLDRPVKTFSIRFTGKDKSYEWFDDASFAVTVARQFGTEHVEKTVTGLDVLNQLVPAVWSMDQPSGDALQYYIVSGCAAEEVTVALSGTGGDEVFAGYEWFKEIRRIEQIQGMLDFIKPEVAFWFWNQIRHLPRTSELSLIRRKLQTLLLGRKGFSTRYMLNRRLYHGDDFYYLFSSDFISRIVDYQGVVADRIEAICERCEGLDPVARMSYLQLKTDMADLLVRDQDAVSMAHSLEVRLPMLDYQLVEAAARIPSTMKLHGNEEKHVLRRAMAHILPETIVKRRKKGFMFPMVDWMRNELKPVVNSCLSREATIRRGIFNPDTIDAMRSEFYCGRKPFFKVWNQVVFELWCRIVLDRPMGWTCPVNEIKDYI